MADFSEVFKAPAAPAGAMAQMAAPGIPVQALSGNQYATMSNLGAITGAQAGGAIGGALSNLVTQAPVVDPVALQQATQEEFLANYQANLAQGMMRGKAMREAADASRLPIDQRLALIGLSEEADREDRKELDTLTTWVNNQDSVKSYKQTYESYQSIGRQLAKDDDPAAQSLAFFEAMKLVDPGVAVTQGEVNFMRAAASGRAFLDLLVGEGDGKIDLNYLQGVINARGQKPTLNKKQRLRFMQALESVVESRRLNALGVLDRASAQWVGGGRRIEQFTNANAALFNQVDPKTNPVLGSAQLEAMGEGTMLDPMAELTPEDQDRINRNAGDMVNRMMPAARTYGRLRGAAQVSKWVGTGTGTVPEIAAATERGMRGLVGDEPIDAAKNYLNRQIESFQDFSSSFNIESSDTEPMAVSKIWDADSSMAIARAQRHNNQLYKQRLIDEYGSYEYGLLMEDQNNGQIAKEMMETSYVVTRRALSEVDRISGKGVHARAKEIQKMMNISYRKARAMAEDEYKKR